jgi:hypothetical protein
MNDLFFACRDCKRFTDAGYRWAYWNLERTGVVLRGQPIKADTIFSAAEYWSTTEADVWLSSILTHARVFINRHINHDLIFGEEEDFILVDTLEFFDWIEDSEQSTVWMPRHFTEQLCLTHWRDVEQYIREHPAEQPWWWSVAEVRLAGRRKFEQLVLAQPRLTT